MKKRPAVGDCEEEDDDSAMFKHSKRSRDDFEFSIEESFDRHLQKMYALKNEDKYQDSFPRKSVAKTKK